MTPSEIMEKYSEVLQLFCTKEYDNMIMLENIVIKKRYRKQGWGKRIMKDLMEYAKENGIILRLYPANARRVYLNFLIGFYSSLGMVEKTDDQGYIYFEI